MLWRDHVLIMTAWNPRDLLYLDELVFLKIWEVFCYYILEYDSYAFTFTCSPSVHMIYRFDI
jgi:hypothetical protein